MNAWEIIFMQSKANNSVYNGDSLLTHNWAWPQETWFQERLRHLRKQQRQTDFETRRLLSVADAGRLNASNRPAVMGVQPWE